MAVIGSGFCPLPNPQTNMPKNIYKFVRTQEIKSYFEVEAENEIEAFELYGLMEADDAQDRRILKSESELLGIQPIDEDPDNFNDFERMVEGSEANMNTHHD